MNDAENNFFPNNKGSYKTTEYFIDKLDICCMLKVIYAVNTIYIIR